MDAIIIFCAKYLIYLLGAAVLIYWLTLPRRLKLQVLIAGVIIAIVGFALAKIGSSLYNDPRPFVTDGVTPLFAYQADNGFPSDHTLVSSILALAIFAVSKKWGIGLWVIAVVIGLARVFAGVHHLTDIIGSLVFTALGLLAAAYFTPSIMRRLTNKRGHD